jgi:disulfide bond formation protein DsbB
MIQWIVIAVIVILALFFLRMEHHTRKLKLIVLALLVFFLYLSLMSVMKSDQVDINSPKGVMNAVYVYFGWLGRTIGNLFEIGVDTARMVGNAVKINNSG